LPESPDLFRACRQIFPQQLRAKNLVHNYRRFVYNSARHRDLQISAILFNRFGIYFDDSDARLPRQFFGEQPSKTVCRELLPNHNP